ncbi:MAG: hypothetical protein E7172_00985 [Firmicutes bacterium]|nr:hypothetical protein [Bacillota bacterium]
MEVINLSNLLKDNKLLMKEYDYEKNINMNLEKLTIGSHNKVWWICLNGHSFKQEIRSKAKGIGCPICNNKLVLKGYNDLATTNSKLLIEWNYEKNNLIGITPYNITKGAEKKVWWICNKCNQSYECFAYSKKENVGCPYCSSKIIKKGLNDIFTKKPNLEKSWDYNKNNINPYTLSISSHKKVWWICNKCNKSFSRKISDIDSDVVLCKECSISDGAVKRVHTIIKNNGSLMDNYPNIAKEWDYEKNVITPDKVTSNSKMKAYWICPNGHSYQSTLSHRINGRRCPICSREMSISFPEKAIVYYISKIEKNIIESFKPDFLSGKEIDIYLPDKNIGIEYDGFAWHKNKLRDIEKNNLCNDNNIKLIRIRENGCPKLDNTSEDYYFEKNENFSNLNEIISRIIKDLYNVEIEVNIEKDRFEIYKVVNYSIKERSLENMRPDIAREWDYQKNEDLKPSQFYSHSSKKFWWICPKGHSYYTSIAKRTDGGGCPYCSNEKILKGYNDLLTTNNEILKEWNYQKNNLNKIFPDEVSKGSHKKVWWICKNHHEWEASINNRIKGRNCPYCSGRKKIVGLNDLATTNPEILEMWDYEKNEKKTPNEFSKGSDYVAWWICPRCKNNWQQRISHITKGIGCPDCHFNPYKINRCKNEGKYFNRNHHRNY